MDENAEFSGRLRAAMSQAGYAVRPTVLEHEFNLRWHGRSISNQTAWSWLNGRNKPQQDKLQVLAEWLRVAPEVLRFGDAVRHRVEERQHRWGQGLDYVEQEAVDAYLRVPLAQRKVVREVILTFATVHAPETDHE